MKRTAGLAAGALATGLLGAAIALPSGTPAAPPGRDLPQGRHVVLGHSVQGRPIEAVRLGRRSSPRKALVVGNIHGDEPAGISVLDQLKRRLRRSGGLRGNHLLLIPTGNPDGLPPRSPQNAPGGGP